MDKLEIKDNFLDDNHLTQLDKLVDNSHFAWYLHKEQVARRNDGCWFSHLIYEFDEPKSEFCDPVIKIFKNYLRYVYFLV